MSNVYLNTVNINLDLANNIEKGFRMPFDGYIKEVGVYANIAPDGANVLTFEAGGVAITGLTLALGTGDVAGTTRVDAPTSQTEYKKGTPISVVTDGGGAQGNVDVMFVLEQK